MTTPAPIDQSEDEEILVPPSDLPENIHQPMEVVAQPENANNVENQPVEDPPSSRFTWRIDNFSRINTKKLYSDIFVVGGYKWRVLIFPEGNNVDHLSMYLNVADSSNLPYGWSGYGQFSLGVVNQIHNKYSVRKDTQHQFNARESGWGFTSFMPLGKLYDPSRGYLVNDVVIIEAEVLVRRVVDYWTYDSKKETGYVGLKNQGATCYMNSLLQTLYHIPYFRKAVYHMPTTENDLPSQSIPLALQSLFYKLQYSDNSVATEELTKSFGWDRYDSFMQHDVQELNRVLCEKLEDKMKGTVVEGTIQKLFEGHHMNYIECIDVDYKSTIKESFYDLQLDVKGCRDVYASFDKYLEVERLEGDNNYHAEQNGLQDAKKGVLFIDFPPVLQLQLKRFEYDFMLDAVVKINDRYEFPLQLDLDRENGKYLSPEADRSVRNLYTLHSVLVHSGGVRGGHYYAFIRPTLSEQWYKFDDERVTKEDIRRALEEQYGGEEELPQTNPGFNNTPFEFTKYSNAYMLVYIRESGKDKMICNVDEKDIAEHQRESLKKEQEAKEHKKKEKAEAHLCTIIKVARDENLLEQIGKDIYFVLVDHDKVRSFRIQKQMPFDLFKEEVAKEFSIPVQFQRFWLWAKRQNHTYCPNCPLTPVEETQLVGQLKEVSEKVYEAELKFLEIELRPDLHPIAPPDKTKDDILLFFKLYEPEKEELRYVVRLFVKSTGEPAEILSKLNELTGYAPDVEIDLHESSWDILQAEVAQYINSNVHGVPYQMQAKTKPLNGLVQRLKGKTGHFRGNLCEKCVEYTGRTVISPDSDLKITEGIRITGPEDPYNDHVLKDLFDSSGTTNIAFANGESIILVVDSRRTWIDTNEIAESEHYKFLDFSDSVPNIVGSQCGNSGICKLIPKHIREMVEKTGQTSVEDITRFIFEFLKTKSEDKNATEQRRDQARKTSTIIATFDCKGPRIFVVNCMNDGPLEIESGQYAFCGSGKNFARTVLESRTDIHRMGDADAITWAQIAMAYATTNDDHTGGTIRARRMTKTGVAEEISKDALQIYLENYVQFTKIEQQLYYKDKYETCTDSTIFLLRHPYKNLSHDDMMAYLRSRCGDIRYCHTWGRLGHTGPFELTSIVLDGDPHKAYDRVKTIWGTAKQGNANSQHRPKEPTYGMAWLNHEDTREFILLARGDDSVVRDRLLETYS